MRKVIAIFVFAALLGGGYAIAQETTGMVRGVVTDDTGGLLPGVTATITDTETGLQRTDITNGKGEYMFAALPPSSYEFTASLDGFQTVKRNITISLGRTTRNDFQMSLGAITDVIEVTGEAPLVDVTSTVSGITVATDELNARMPVQRESNYIALLAPATVIGDTAFDDRTPGQNAISIGGASVAENSYLVNGLNITNFRNGLGSSFVPLEFIEEVQVKTGGYEAEYGRSTGGVVNMVTKSGSNTLRGSASIYYEPKSLQEQESNTYARPNEDEERESLEGNFSIGAPILKDKLFFFGFVRYVDTERLALTGDTENVVPGAEGQAIRSDHSDPYWGGKVDFNLNASHRLEGTYISDDTTVDYNQRTWDMYDRNEVGNGVSGYDKRGGANYILKYTGIMSENILVSVQYGINEFDRSGYNAEATAPYSFDQRDGFPQDIGHWLNYSVGPSSDERTAYRLDGDFYFGSHSLRSGIDYEHNESLENTGYAGGYRVGYYDYPDSPTGYYAEVRHYSANGSFKVNSNAAYVQDSWAVTPNLTVNLGVRWEQFENMNAAGETFIKTDNQWAPRLGVIWDPSNEGRSKLFASFGMYYLPIASNTNVRMAGYEQYDRARYYWDGEMNADGSPFGYEDCGFGNTEACANQGSVGDLFYGPSYFAVGTLVDPREVVSSNFDPMSQNEFVVGYEQMFSDNWSLGARVVARTFNEVIEDYTIDQALYAQYGICAPEDGGCFAYRLGNPGSDFEGWYDVDGDGELDPVSFSAEELGYAKAERNYYALELTFKRRFADNWMLQGSYTWSHLYGNYEGYVNSEIGQDDAGITQGFDFPGLMDHSRGNLAQDRRHNLKIFGAYAFDMGLQVGGNFYYSSGRPLNSLGVHPTDQFAQLYDNFSFFTDGVPVPRGTAGETEDLLGLDAMVKYDFKIGDIDMNVRLDVFNLFDNDGAVEINEFGELGSGELNPDFMKDTHYQQPRTVRFGVGLTF